MKKILSLILILIFSLSIGMTTSAKYYTLEEATDELSKVEKASFVNEDGWYYKTVNDVTLYVKLEKEHYVVGDKLKYVVRTVNYSDKCVGLELSHMNLYYCESLSVGPNTYLPSRDYPALFLPNYNKAIALPPTSSDKLYYQTFVVDQEKSDEYISGASILKAETYTLGIIVDFKFGYFNDSKDPLGDEYFTSTDNESHKIFLAIDIPVYESESDIPDTKIPVVPGPEKTKLSYYEKYPEPTKPIIEESTTVAPTTKLTTTETTTITPSETIKQDASIIPNRIGYIIIALSVAVIITAVIIFVVVNKKKK